MSFIKAIGFTILFIAMIIASFYLGYLLVIVLVLSIIFFISYTWFSNIEIKNRTKEKTKLRNKSFLNTKGPLFYT